MAIYFVRHGKSKANEQGVFAGQKEDSPLVEEGESQASHAAKELVGKRINKVISSPLICAKQTAKIVMDVAGLGSLDLEIDQRIAEYDMGSLTGTPLHAITSLELTSSDGAEDPEAFLKRVISFLRDYKDDSILMVAHAGVGRIIEAAKRGIEPAEFYGIEPYPNGHVLELDLDWLDKYEQ